MKLRSALLAATFLAAAPVAAKAQAVSGLYVGAGAGVNFMQDQTLTSVGFPGLAVSPVSILGGTAGFTSGFANSNRTVRMGTGFNGQISLGYGLGNGLRFEVEAGYQQNKFKGVGAFYGATPAGTFGTGSIPGGTFNAGGDEMKYRGMVNVLYDFAGLGLPVVPYIGGGVGYAWAQHRNAHIYGNTGSLVGFPTGINTLFRSNDGEGDFAYQGIAGISFPLPVPGLSLTAEYRFLGLVGDRNYNYQFYATGPTPGGINTRAVLKYNDDYNHSIMLGVRYAFNAAPPPVQIQPPAPVQPTASRTYLVFFDWDRADLTDRARQIIAEAAQATTRVQVTRIEVNGYTDRSGTPQYNQGLSVRRATNVANELMRDGVPRQAITVRGFGESNPLVPTADGVREPQNRRVEIILR